METNPLRQQVGVNNLYSDEELPEWMAWEDEEEELDPNRDLKLQVMCLKVIVGHPYCKAEASKRKLWPMIREICYKNRKSIMEYKLVDDIPGWSWSMDEYPEKPRTYLEEALKIFEDIVYEQKEEIRDLKRRLNFLEHYVYNKKKKILF